MGSKFYKQKPQWRYNVENRSGTNGGRTSPTTIDLHEGEYYRPSDVSPDLRSAPYKSPEPPVNKGALALNEPAVPRWASDGFRQYLKRQALAEMIGRTNMLMTTAFAFAALWDDVPLPPGNELRPLDLNDWLPWGKQGEPLKNPDNASGGKLSNYAGTDWWSQTTYVVPAGGFQELVQTTDVVPYVENHWFGYNGRWYNQPGSDRYHENYTNAVQLPPHGQPNEPYSWGTLQSSWSIYQRGDGTWWARLPWADYAPGSANEGGSPETDNWQMRRWLFEYPVAGPSGPLVDVGEPTTRIVQVPAGGAMPEEGSAPGQVGWSHIPTRSPVGIPWLFIPVANALNPDHEQYGPEPKPLPDSGSSVTVPPGGSVTTGPGVPFARPRGPQGKWETPFARVFYVARKVFHEITEASDIIDALFDNLPKSARKGVRSDPASRAYAVASNLDKLDLAGAIVDLIYNNLEDRVAGKLFAVNAAAAKARGGRQYDTLNSINDYGIGPIGDAYGDLLKNVVNGKKEAAKNILRNWLQQ